MGPKSPSCQVLISTKLQISLRMRLAKFKGEGPKLALVSQLQLLDHLPAHYSNQFAIGECELIKKFKNEIMGQQSKKVGLGRSQVLHGFERGC
jgi:hypothetical protein